MRYYGNITKQLQFTLVKRWVKYNWFARIICKLIGIPVCSNLPYPNLIEELTKVEL